MFEIVTENLALSWCAILIYDYTPPTKFSRKCEIWKMPPWLKKQMRKTDFTTSSNWIFSFRFNFRIQAAANLCFTRLCYWVKMPQILLFQWEIWYRLEINLTFHDAIDLCVGQLKSQSSGEEMEEKRAAFLFQQNTSINTIEFDSHPDSLHISVWESQE